MRWCHSNICNVIILYLVSVIEKYNTNKNDVEMILSAVSSIYIYYVCINISDAVNYYY